MLRRAASPLHSAYTERLDRDSAAEMLARRADEAAKEAEAAEAAEEAAEAEEREFRAARRYRPGEDAPRSSSRRRKADEGLGGALAHAFVKEMKGTTGRRLVRGIMGGLFRGR